MKSFLRTIFPVTLTVLALTYPTACSSDGDDEATGGKDSGGSGGTSGSSTGGKGGSGTGGSSGQGGSTGGANPTGGSSTGGASGDGGGAPGGAGGAGEQCGSVICPEGTFCSDCFNPDNPDEPLRACIAEGMSC
jgi:hypothetical protein